MDFSRVKKKLESNGFKVSVFPDKEAASAYLDKEIDGKTVGIGGSVTVSEMGLAELLKTHNTVCWHWIKGADAAAMMKGAGEAELYISSVNALAETGEIINIDGVGNRVSSIIYGHKKVYFVVGSNKLAENYEAALFRARNMAAPLNAKRIGTKTPCAAAGDKCYDCSSPERICNALSVLWKRPKGCEYEIVLIDEALGY